MACWRCDTRLARGQGAALGGVEGQRPVGLPEGAACSGKNCGLPLIFRAPGGILCNGNR